MAANYGNIEPKKEGQKYYLPKIEGRVRPKFLLFVSPDAWTWDPGAKEYLPELCKLPLIPGVNGVEDVDNYAQTVAEFSRKGRIVLENGDARLAIKGDPAAALAVGQYRAQHLARLGQKINGKSAAIKVYSWAWESYVPVSRDTVEWSENAEARRRFARHLIASGIVPKMTLSQRYSKIRALEGVIRKMSSRKNHNPQRMADKTRELEALLADYEAAGGKLDRKGTTVKPVREQADLPTKFVETEAEIVAIDDEDDEGGE